MGLILDTSVLIAAERRRLSVAAILKQIQETWGETQNAISAVTIVEFAHGIQRAKTDAQRTTRQAFLDDLRAAVTVYPLSGEIAELAGAISGREAERGIVLPFADLLIGATALHLGFDVISGNVRHFEMIPGLVVRNG